MKLVMLPLARREMFRAARWYDRKSPGLGDRLLDEIRQSLLAVLEFPAAFPSIDLTHRRKLLDVFPYNLVYRIDEETITIIAVANFKRHPEYWRRRTKGSAG
jgi:plasmid stabilization system protein ParE